MGALIPFEQAERLRRENWQGQSGSTRLAQEIYAILTADLPISSTSPVTLTQKDPTQPVLTVVPSTDPGAVPATNISGGGGGINPASITWPATPNPGSTSGKGTIVLYGRVQSGTGTTYTVRVWMLDPDTENPIGDFTVTQENLAVTETVPPGTPVLVWCPLDKDLKAGAMRMIVPTFLA